MSKWKYAFMKILKTNSNKTGSQLTIDPYYLSHNTIQELNCVVHYLNIKMKEKSVEIIDFQLGSLLKLYHV